MEGPSPIRQHSPDWRHTHMVKPSPTQNNSTSSITDIKSAGPHLPSLNHINLEKIRTVARENDHKLPSPITTTTHTSVQSMNSPVSGYPGPPPPYSSLVGTPTSTIGGLGGYTSQAEPRRPVDNDKERPAPNTLPSISEALGKEPPSFYRGPPQSAPIPQPSSAISATSPTTPIHRAHANSLTSHPPNLHETHHPTYPAPPPHPISRAEHPPRPNLEIFQRDPYRPPRPEEQPRHPLPHESPYQQNSPHPSVRHPQSHPSTPSFFPQPPSQPIPPIQQAAPPHTPTYPPAFSYPPPSTLSHSQYPASNWRGTDYGRQEDERRAPPPPPSHTMPQSTGRRSPGPYHHGESVKRHLETFDLELGLNEIAVASSQTLDFARKYVDKAHHMQRSGIATALPTLDECDEMYKIQRSALNSMDRIREIVVAQQHALAEQKSREEASKARQSSFAEHSNGMYDKDDGSGGFAGSDPKKRRGRHAPPGRCHSCARQETPEWRRGPDGARTLCNACGLHYAKLTRKLGPKAPIGSSNLRPKDGDVHSP